MKINRYIIISEEESEIDIQSSSQASKQARHIMQASSIVATEVFSASFVFGF